MYEEGVQVKIGKREYHMVFTLAALLAIKKKYGGIKEMSKQFYGPTIEEWDDETVKAEKLAAQEKAQIDTVDELPWLLSVLVNQGELLKDPKAELFTADQIALYIMPKDIESLMGAAMDAINIGMGSEHPEESGKRDTVLEELDEKNAVGAGEK